MNKFTKFLPVFLILSTTYSIFAQGAGKALSFDGSNDFVNVPDSPNWDLGSSDFTIEFWAKLSSTPTNNNGLVTRSTGDISAGTFDGWALAIQANKYVSFLGGVPGGSTVEVNVYSDDVTDLKWHHIAATRSGNTFSTYTDGGLSNTGTWSGSFSDLTQDLYIGYWNNYNYYDGVVDEVRIWNVARTQTQIRD